MTTMNAPADAYPPGWWLTLPQLCALLSISPRLWEQWSQHGTAPAHHTGADGIVRVHRADLTAWLDHLRTERGAHFLTPDECLYYLDHPDELANLPHVPRSQLPPDEWLTVPDICAEMNIEPEEWQEWRADGNSPRHITDDDGTARIRRADFNAWMDSLPKGNLLDFLDEFETDGE